MPNLPPVFNGPKTTKQNKTRQAKARNENRALKTNSARWRRLRAICLQREPLCRECRKEGKTTAATDLDHIDGNAYNNSMDNLQCLCRSCHSTKTAAEMGRNTDGTFT